MTKGDSLSSKIYIHMKGTLSSLLELGLVPINNENDEVRVDEIKIGEKKYQDFQKSIGTIKWYLSSRKRRPCGIKIF